LAASIRQVPIYKLYGEAEQWLTPDMVHCESIAARSSLHDWQIKPHQHHGLFQILYLKDGAATVRVDERIEALRPGQVLLVPQMCIHGFEFARDAEGLVITLAYPLIRKISPAIADLLASWAGAQVHCLQGLQGAHVEAALRAFADAYRGDALHRNLLMDSLLGALLVWLTRDVVVGEGRQGDNLPARGVRRSAGHFGAFCQMIEQTYAGHHALAWYAGKLGITAAHLNSLCRLAVDRSALELIHERLLLEARRNLVYTTMSINLVSDALGFADPAYFTRFFKRATGLTPVAFRKRALMASSAHGP